METVTVKISCSL